MRDLQKEIAEDYQEFFNFLNKEHNLILTKSEMDEIVFVAQNLVKKLSLGVVVGRSEQLCIHEPTKKITPNLYNETQCKKCGEAL